MMNAETPTPRRPPRPTSGNSTRRTISGIAGSVLGACRPGSAQSGGRRGAPRPTSAGSRQSDKSIVVGAPQNIGLVFTPHRPPSARSIMQRQSRALNIAVMRDGTTEEDGTHQAATTAAGSGGMAGNFFDLVVKPFLVMKGTTHDDRREVFLLWSVDLAHNMGLCLETDVVRLVGEFLAQSRVFLPADRGGDETNSTGSFVIGEDDASSGQTVHITFIPDHSVRRPISTGEVKAFLHMLTREMNIDEVILGAVVLEGRTPVPSAASTAVTSGLLEGSLTSASRARRPLLHIMMTPLQRLQVFLRTLLHCCAVASDDMADFDFRTKSALGGRSKTDRYFSLAQGSDLDSTDEDYDDGAPRPLDAVILTAAELVLAHVKRLGLHDRSGAVFHPDALPIEASGVADDLLRLIQRVSSDSNADRSFGILLGLVLSFLNVIDAHRGVISPQALLPLLEYLDEQRSFYTMKADGITMNKELVELYEGMTEPFYRLIRTLRVLKGSSSAVMEADNSNVDMASDLRGNHDGPFLAALDCLERFIYYRSAERAYDPLWTQLFHLEMTSRERMISCERARYVGLIQSLKHLVPVHGTTIDYLSGGVLYRLKESERESRETLLQEEARKHAFFARLLEARCTMPLETDPRRIANHLVPTTRAPHIASLYDGDHHVHYSPSRPPIRPQSSSLRSVAGGASSGGTHRPGSASVGKESFFSSHRARDVDATALSQCRHEESGSRLAVRQQEADHWFVIAMQRRLELERSHPPCGLTQNHQEAPKETSEGPDVYSSIHVLIADTCRSVTTWDRECAFAWKIDKLVQQESSMRRDVLVGESLERDIELVPMYQSTIADAMYSEAVQHALEARFREMYDILLHGEQAARHAILDEEEATFSDRIKNEYAASAERMGALLKAHLLRAAEQEARGKLMYTEESSLDMLWSMYQLEKNIYKDIFRRTMIDAEANRKAAERAQAAAAEEERIMLRQQLSEEVEDVLRIQSVVRGELVEAEWQEHVELKHWFQRGIVDSEYQTTRSNVETIERVALTALKVRCYIEGIVLLQTEIGSLDVRIDACGQPDVSPTLDPSENDPTRPQRVLAGAALRAELLLVQQRCKILRGSFRYHLSTLLPFHALDRIQSASPNELYGHILHATASAVSSPHDSMHRCPPLAPLDDHSTRVVSPLRRLSPCLVEECMAPADGSTSPSALPALPHLENIRGNIRSYSRPVSAAKAAATALAVKQQEQIAYLRIGSAASRALSASAPSLASVGLTGRMTAFNRVYLSEGSKRRVQEAVLQQQEA